MRVLFYSYGQGPADAELKGPVVYCLEEGVSEDRVLWELLPLEDRVLEEHGLEPL
jgi:hypothetical protein